MEFKLKEKNAALWKRLLSYIIDSFVVYFIILFPFKGYYNTLTTSLNNGILTNPDILNQLKDLAPKFFLISFIVALLTILYWAIFEYYFKQSIGKMLFKIRITSTKKTLKFWQSFLRNISKSSLLILFIDSIFILFSKNNQRFFEKISKTKVIERGLEI